MRRLDVLISGTHNDGPTMFQSGKYQTFKYVIKIALFVYACGSLILLLMHSPKTFDKLCPVVRHSTTDNTTQHLADQQVMTAETVNCHEILYGDVLKHKDQLESTKWCKRVDAISNRHYVRLASDCNRFIQTRGYFDIPVSHQEEQFPLAFSILMHDKVEQMERLLRAVYRPHNFYCIHVDAKSAAGVHGVIEAIGACLPNVTVISHPIRVLWAEYSVLEAELMCLRELWKYPEWQYYLNLAGTEFPLRTNLELVRIMKAYRGGNEVGGSINRRPFEWTKYSYRREFWRTNHLKSLPPHRFNIAKGPTHVAVSRRFADFALHDHRALDLLEWMKDIRVPDEHFFPTLNSNPHIDIPGAYTGNLDMKEEFLARYKIWYGAEKTCYGKWVGYICVLGAADLQTAIQSKHFFINKLNLDMDPVAYQCLEQWYYDRVGTRHNPDFDIEFYKSRKLVKYHV